MHVQLKAQQKFYIEKEIAQVKVENAVCSAVSESVYIKHKNSVLSLCTACIFMSNSCFSLSQHIELCSFGKKQSSNNYQFVRKKSPTTVIKN